MLSILKRLEASLWLLNADERMKDINRRLDAIRGTQEAQEKKFKAFEKYFGVEFISGYRYKKK